MVDIEAFYDSHVDKIYNFCLYRTGNRFVAEDLASSTFLKFFKAKWKQVDNPKAYLYSICRNVIADHFRSSKSDFSLDTLLEEGQDFGATEDHEKRLLYSQAISEIQKLPEDQKEVILMQYVEDLDNKTIAQSLGKTESAVKSLAHRGLTTLRDKMNR